MLCLLGAGCGSGHHGDSINSSTADSQSGSKASEEASTVSSEGSSETSGEVTETTLTCPSAEQLQEDVPSPSNWTLYEEGKHAAEHFYQYDSHVVPAFDRLCRYDGGSETYGYEENNSSLVVIFADYPPQVAKEQFAALQTRERECSPQSICGAGGEVIEDPTSFVAWQVQDPYEDGEPFIAHVDAASVTEGTVCEMISRDGSSNELVAAGEEDLLPMMPGLHKFIRTVCSLPEEAEAGEEPEGSSKGLSSLAGTTDDQAGAEQTYLAYNRALDEADYETACELTIQKSLEKLPKPCPDEMAQVFHGQKFSPKEMQEVEAKVIESVPLKMSEGELLWDGSEWLVDPEASEEVIEEE